jgi:hypothetical protein
VSAIDISDCVSMMSFSSAGSPRNGQSSKSVIPRGWHDAHEKRPSRERSPSRNTSRPRRICAGVGSKPRSSVLACSAPTLPQLKISTVREPRHNAARRRGFCEVMHKSKHCACVGSPISATRRPPVSSATIQSLCALATKALPV